MSLVSVAEVTPLVHTTLDEPQLQAVINRVEAELVDRLGELQDSTGLVEITETGWVSSGGRIYTSQKILSVVSLSLNDVILSATEYHLDPEGGIVDRIVGLTQYSPARGYSIIYRPTDIRLAVKDVVIDLVRLTVERTSMRSESVAGEYSFTAPNWEAERLRIIRRIIPRGRP